MPRPSTAAVLCALLSLVSSAHASTQKVLSGDVCQHPPYEVHIVSSSPLVVYLENFVTPDECAHLKRVTEHTFAHSAVAEKGTADGRAIHSVRTSQSTNVPRDSVVRCIEERALRFQGLLGEGNDRLEPLQLVKYGNGEHYHYHTDWFTDPVHATAALGGNRASSFFAYVHVSGTNTSQEIEKPLRGGGTNFPLLTAPTSPEWCAFVDCDEPWERGVTFRPLQGNAVYWENLLPHQHGDGDHRTLHAGLPVVGGEKIGMNIWTRQGTVPAEVRGV
ncbi:hypothetical protein SEUCBS139899_000906 [Sporothrix eucalyptigena]|uniref:Prolyl 4-hydroxylase alpha subunit domain-containing protein n=1 Tax=Sporothrix eucalyptigena TaxID=1812306 RepID=A0ABP0BJ77_9PEZI